MECHQQFGMQNAAFARAMLRRAARLPTKVRSPHEGEFFLDTIKYPVALLQTVHSNFFYLANCVQMHFQINTLPAVFAQGDDVFNRTLLLLPASIGEGFRYGALGKIKRIGETERHEIAGKTSVILDALVEKLLFQLGWDVDRVSYRFHKYLHAPRTEV